MSFVCALLVVLIHVGEDCAVLPTRLANKVMGNGICLIAVPYFFVVSGFFVAHADWRHACFKRLRTLLVPYLIWEILMLLYGDLITLACNLRAGRGLLSNISLAPLDVLREIGVLDWSCAPVHGALWYVRALLLFVLCLPLIRFFVRRFGWWCVGVLWLVAFAVVAGLISIPLGFRGFFEWSFPLWGLAYFAAGICLADHPIPDRIGKRLSLVALVFGFALLGYVLVRNLSCEYSSGGGGNFCFVAALLAQSGMQCHLCLGRNG